TRESAAPGGATPAARSGSPRRAVTSLTSAAPSSSARRATSALAVSIETGTPSSSSSTGTTRHSSSSAETPAEPGRVDSPPTSTIAAPSSTMRRADSTATSGRKLTPPSENESGVTLTTPITDGRGNRSSIGGLIAPRSLVCDQPALGCGLPRGRWFLDEPQAAEARNPAHQRAGAGRLAEHEHGAENAEDRDEERECRGPRGADPAHPLVEEDERKDCPEHRQVEDRGPGGAVSSGQLRPALSGHHDRQ